VLLPWFALVLLLLAEHTLILASSILLALSPLLLYADLFTPPCSVWEYFMQAPSLANAHHVVTLKFTLH
jgi:hypothetical protein